MKININKQNDSFFKFLNRKNDLSKDQSKAYFRILNNSFSILYGNAGTGKTFLISWIIKKFISLKESYILLAPTHKAVAVSAEMLSEGKLNSSTIQSNSWCKKEHTNIIIDESSMIDDEMWEKLFEYLEYHKINRLILLGDDAQLKPIRSFGLFNEILRRKKKDIINLKTNHRFDEKLVKLMHGIRNGVLPHGVEHFRKYRNFKEMKKIANEFIESKIKLKEDVKIISPIKFGLYGTKNLLAAISDTTFKIGDSIIMSEQEYPIKNIIYQNKIAKIKDIQSNKIILNIQINEHNTHMLKAPWLLHKLEQKNYLCTYYNEEDLPFSKSKTITVHSSQGSTFDNVIFILPPKYKIDFKMVYTGVSRTKNDFLILKWDGDI